MKSCASQDSIALSSHPKTAFVNNGQNVFLTVCRRNQWAVIISDEIDGQLTQRPEGNKSPMRLLFGLLTMWTSTDVSLDESVASRKPISRSECLKRAVDAGMAGKIIMEHCDDLWSE
jgi:hypothetical protein